jgi:hypothetical protein
MSGMGDVKLAEAKAGLHKPAFDTEAFGKHLRKNVSAKTFGEGKCAKHVREALFAHGRKLATWPVSAKDWGPSLLALGFTPVDAATHVPQAGDIAVIQPPKGETHGHIQGHDGTNWISDFVQKEFWPGPSFRKDKPAYVIYRY